MAKSSDDMRREPAGRGTGRVQPLRPQDLRASDADRERVVELLREATAEGRLELAEFEERMEAVYKAKTFADLAPITRDLPGAGGADAPSAGPAWSGRIGGEPTSQRAVAVFGEFRRSRKWTVPARFTASAICGGGRIDLSDADFESRDTEIRVVGTMSTVEVLVPADADVRVKGGALFGAVDASAEGPGAPGAPRITVVGAGVFLQVVVVRDRGSATSAPSDSRRSRPSQPSQPSRPSKPSRPAAGTPGRIGPRKEL